MNVAQANHTNSQNANNEARGRRISEVESGSHSRVHFEYSYSYIIPALCIFGRHSLSVWNAPERGGQHHRHVRDIRARESGAAAVHDNTRVRRALFAQRDWRGEFPRQR